MGWLFWVGCADATIGDSAHIAESDTTDTSPDPHTGDTADIVAPFTTASGWEVYERAEWLDEPSLRSCVLRWDLTAVPARACDGCEFAFRLTMDLNEAHSTDDGTCASIYADRQETLAYTEDFEGGGPTVLIEVDGQWFWWAFAARRETGLYWWFGAYEVQALDPDNAPPDHYLDWLTSWWESELFFEG